MSEQLSIEARWAEFKTTHNKSYDPEEEAKRFEIFKENVKTIDEHNKKYETGEVTYTKGVNKFADLTHEEFSETYLMKPRGGGGGLLGSS